jgi:hypothetical protein
MRPGVGSASAISVCKCVNYITGTSRVTGHYWSRYSKRSATIISNYRRCWCSSRSRTSHGRSSYRWHCHYRWRYCCSVCPRVSNTRAISVCKCVNYITGTGWITSHYRSRNSKRSTTIIRYSRRCWCSSRSRTSHGRSSCSRHSH